MHNSCWLSLSSALLLLLASTWHCMPVLHQHMPRCIAILLLTRAALACTLATSSIIRWLQAECHIRSWGTVLDHCACKLRPASPSRYSLLSIEVAWQLVLQCLRGSYQCWLYVVPGGEGAVVAECCVSWLRVACSCISSVAAAVALLCWLQLLAPFQPAAGQNACTRC